jgi:hypothetical protein
MPLEETVAPHVINDGTNIVWGGANVTVEEFLGLLSSPCLKETMLSVPEVYLNGLTCLVLALFGDKDKQVPAGENMSAMKKSLEDAGNRDYTVETIAGIVRAKQSIFRCGRVGKFTSYKQILNIGQLAGRSGMSVSIHRAGTANMSPCP